MSGTRRPVGLEREAISEGVTQQMINLHLGRGQNIHAVGEDQDEDDRVSRVAEDARSSLTKSPQQLVSLAKRQALPEDTLGGVPAKRPSFLDLPGELRNKIYRYYVADSQIDEEQHYYNLSGRLSNWINPNIMHLNRQIRAEVSPFIYGGDNKINIVLSIDEIIRQTMSPYKSYGTRWMVDPRPPLAWGQYPILDPNDPPRMRPLSFYPDIREPKINSFHRRPRTFLPITDPDDPSIMPLLPIHSQFRTLRINMFCRLPGAYIPSIIGGNEHIQSNKVRHLLSRDIHRFSALKRVEFYWKEERESATDLQIFQKLQKFTTLSGNRLMWEWAMLNYDLVCFEQLWTKIDISVLVLQTD